MRYIILTSSQNQEISSEAERFSDELTRLTSVKNAELIDFESQEGQRLASLYGVASFPSVLVIQSMNGSMVKMWQGHLPLVQEVPSQSF